MEEGVEGWRGSGGMNGEGSGGMNGGGGEG